MINKDAVRKLLSDLAEFEAKVSDDEAYDCLVRIDLLRKHLALLLDD